MSIGGGFSMGLFSKRCSVCGRKLPDKRKFKGVCDFCGMNYKTFSKQMNDTITIVKNGKNVVTCYNRCLFGLNLTDSLRRYEDAGLYTFPAGSADAQKKFFIKCSQDFRRQVELQNEKKKYSQKIGLAPLSFYTQLYGKNSTEWKEGYCKACHKNSETNDVGYCFDCIYRATALLNTEKEIYIHTHDVSKLPDQEITDAAIKEKLLIQKHSESKPQNSK